jgi:hypothetical protein
MDGSDEDSSQSDSTDEHDIEALRVSQEEARAVLDHQIESFRQIDDKAARTFRLEGLLLGLILTAVSFIARSSDLTFEPVLNPWTIGGVALLITSFILAVITFTVTDINTGLGSSDIQRLVEKKYSEKEWLILLLRSEAAWMDDNSYRQDVNAKLLTASHVTLILAIISLTLGIVLPFV